MVILPLFFQLCEFTPAFWKRRQSLPLFRERQVMVLELLGKDQFALADLPLLLYEFGDFTPVFE
jgi:hypothetical protein